MARATAHKRALALAGAFLLTAAVPVTLAMVPTLSSESTLVPAADPPPSVVLLHLDDDGRYFAYGATTKQHLKPAKNGCQIASPETFIHLSSTPAGTSPNTASSPGIVDDSLGVKRMKSSSNGTPCGQVDGPESLTVGLKEGQTIVDRSFTAVRLDLELTSDAIVRLDFGGVPAGTSNLPYFLQSGNNIDEDEEPELDEELPFEVASDPDDTTDGCATPNSSGPNAGPLDNCLWSVDPGFEFTSITLTATVGTAALEGGGDFHDFGGPDGFETLFELENAPPNAVDDSFDTDVDTPLTGNVLANDSDPDGDSLTAALSPDAPGEPNGPTNGTLDDFDTETGSFSYTPDPGFVGTDSFRYLTSDGDSTDEATVTIQVFAVICQGFPAFDEDEGIDGEFTLLGDPDDPEAEVPCKRYTLDASAADESVTFAPTGESKVAYRGVLHFPAEEAPIGDYLLGLKYDPTGGAGTPRPVQWCIDPEFDEGLVIGATLPPVEVGEDPETWCVAKAETVPNGVGDLETEWQVYGVDDPRFTR